METEHTNPLECPICYDLFHNAFETYCGHAFCEYCLYKALETSHVCPICRRDPSPIHPSYTLRALVQERREINQIEKAEPMDSLKETYMGNLCYRLKQYAQAIQHYSNALYMCPNSVAFANRGASYFKLRQFRMALNDYQRAEELEPANVRLQIGKALTLEKLCLFREAFSTFQKAGVMNDLNANVGDINMGIQRLLPYVACPAAITTLTTREDAELVNTYWPREVYFKELLGYIQM